MEKRDNCEVKNIRLFNIVEKKIMTLYIVEELHILNM